MRSLWAIRTRCRRGRKLEISSLPSCPSSRHSSHTGISITHLGAGSVAQSSLARLLHRRRAAYHVRGTAPDLVEDASLLEQTGVFASTGCAAHDISNAIRRGMSAAMPVNEALLKDVHIVIAPLLSMGFKRARLADVVRLLQETPLGHHVRRASAWLDGGDPPLARSLDEASLVPPHPGARVPGLTPHRPGGIGHRAPAPEGRTIRAATAKHANSFIHSCNAFGLPTRRNYDRLAQKFADDRASEVCSEVEEIKARVALHRSRLAQEHVEREVTHRLNDNCFQVQDLLGAGASE